MRKRLEDLIASKKNVNINFSAASGARLVSVAGTVTEAGDDFLVLTDIYGNNLLIPYAGIAYIEMRK